ncbi:AAA family ATPase [Clostridium thermarum]|uniref:AAA family ATPase n=1 Tax=Clostridium thermarum TaxID=1716543 RepID=UPI0011245C84|nr:AAA family ATPase [Clostridium thermarum]
MNFKEALLTSELILKSGAVPMLVGESGIGKTALVRELAERNGYYLVNIDGNLLKEGEIGGLPIVEDYSVYKDENKTTKKRTVYAVHHKLQEIDKALEENSKRPVLLFIDELNRCEHVVQQELMNIILNREINGYKLPANTLVMAAMNPSSKFNNFSASDYQVVEMDPAQENRFVWLELESDAASWLLWGKRVGIHQDVLNFISIFPQYLHKPDMEGAVRATPRSWERVSRIYEAATANKDHYSSDIFLHAVKGNVGPYIAQEFMNFINNKDKSYLIASELLNRDTLDEELIARIKNESYEKQYLLAVNCIGEISENPNPRIIRYFTSIIRLFPKDLRMAIMKKIKRDMDQDSYESFLDCEEFIEGYFEIFIEAR